MKFVLLLLLVLFSNYNYGSEIEEKMQAHFFSPDIRSLSIADWQNPTLEDYLNIQQFLKEKVLNLIHTPVENRPFHNGVLNEEFYGWMTYRMNRGCLAKDNITKPLFCTEYFNNDPNQREKCVICYASFPSGSPIRDYPKAINNIIASLKKFKFDGHFIYRIGGWPNVQGGRLKFADVPFGFKPFLFEEVRNLGYQNILWIDACCVPVKSLDPIFDLIRTNGICFYSYGSKMSWREFNNGYKYLMPHLGLASQPCYEEISSQVIGIHVRDSKANHLLNQWIEAAEQKIPFLMSDEPPFKFLVNYLNLEHYKMPDQYYIETPCITGDFTYWKRQPNAIIYHQYDFLSPEFIVPNDLYDH